MAKMMELMTNGRLILDPSINPLVSLAKIPTVHDSQTSKIQIFPYKITIVHHSQISKIPWFPYKITCSPWMISHGYC